MDEKNRKIREKLEKHPGGENLIPLTEQSKERQREIRSMGGIAAQKKIKQRKLMKESLEYMLGLTPELPPNVLKVFEELGINKEELNFQTLALFKQVEQSTKGDLASLQFLRDTIGEKPTEQIGLTHDMMGNFKIVIDAEPEHEADA